MYDIATLLLTLALFAKNGPVIATKIEAIHPFRDGRSIMEEITGRKVTVTFPAAGYEQLEIKVSDPTDALTPLLVKASYQNPIYVDFDGFAGRFYQVYDKVTKTSKTVLSVKASAVRVVPGPSDGLDID